LEALAYRKRSAASRTLAVGTDVWRCADENDAPLEGKGVRPTHAIEYDSADLAAGRDTLLEAAVTLVK
jgi:C-terminal processing protease CtpA/Prc